ncbi:hypothetical protein L107_00815 [Cyanobium sp. Copco_Reservoir_LC18]|jgi:hypothetical protein|nr:hypothetical protein L107_00815 [Cyanobium sp. Copco_Reservoir_LC18]
MVRHHEELWLPTSQAARALGISPHTLKRYADRDGFLIEGTHCRRGPYPNSPRVWEVNGCRQAMSWRQCHGRPGPGST